MLRPTSRATRFAASSERDEASPFPRDDDHGICRWLAYSGSPVLLEELLYNRQNSLIVQSLHSRLGAEETNGDGFGVGWYGGAGDAGVFRSIEPAWNDRNLRELSGHIESGLVFAHIRASTGSPVQQTNCHPFRHGRWLFMHNGFIDGLHEIKRDLALAVDPSLYPEIEGTTDTELMFHLALTFGLEDDPPQAVARMVGFVEATGRAHGVEFPFQGTIATTDGECIWAFRYSSEGNSRSLFFSTDLRTLRELYPENERAPRPRRRVPAGRLRAARRPARRVERGARGLVRRDPAGPGRDASVRADDGRRTRLGARRSRTYERRLPLRSRRQTCVLPGPRCRARVARAARVCPGGVVPRGARRLARRAPRAGADGSGAGAGPARSTGWSTRRSPARARASWSTG